MKGNPRSSGPRVTIYLQDAVLLHTAYVETASTWCRLFVPNTAGLKASRRVTALPSRGVNGQVSFRRL